MEKMPIKKDLFCLPWTQTILGTHFEGKVNFMALDWLTRVNYQPPMGDLRESKQRIQRCHKGHTRVQRECSG